MIYVIIIALVILLVLCAVWACISTVYMWKFAKMVMSVEDSVEQSLDILDTCYADITTVLTIPVASDDPHTRSVINSIKDARSAVLLVAQKISVIDEVEVSFFENSGSNYYEK